MKKHIGKVKEAYNETHFGGFGDLIESLLQKLSAQEYFDDKVKELSLGLFETSHARNLNTQVKAYKESIESGHKVLVVAHSQGNLFTYEARNRIMAESKNAWMDKYFQVISIASPAMFSISSDTPLISWDNDLVAWLGVYNGSVVNNDIRRIVWEGVNPDSSTTSNAQVPSSNYVKKSQLNSVYKNEWKAVESVLGKFDSVVHAFTFYMGEDLAEGKILNPFDGSKLHTDKAKILIMNAVDEKITYLEGLESQWTPKNLGCACKDKYAKMTHKFSPDIMNKYMENEKVKDFAEGSNGKIYRADAGDYSVYVRAENAERVAVIEAVDDASSNVCAVLKGADGVKVGEIEGVTFSLPKGLFTANLTWHEKRVHMELSNSLMSDHESGCGMAAAGSGGLTLDDVKSGTYPIYAVNVDGYQDIDDTNLSDTMSLYVHAVTASKQGRIVITKKYQYPNVGATGGHIADIVIRNDPSKPATVEIVPSASGSWKYVAPFHDQGDTPPLCKPAQSCGCLPCEYSILMYLNQTKLGPIVVQMFVYIKPQMRIKGLKIYFMRGELLSVAILTRQGLSSCQCLTLNRHNGMTKRKI